MPRKPSRFLAGLVSLLASLACMAQVYWLMAWGVWAAPSNPLHLIAHLGGVVLFVASITLMVTGGRKAAIVCAGATAPLWLFYGPATVAAIGDPGEVSDLTIRLAFTPPVLLLFCTVLAVYTASRSDSSSGYGLEIQRHPPGHDAQHPGT